MSDSLDPIRTIAQGGSMRPLGGPGPVNESFPSHNERALANAMLKLADELVAIRSNISELQLDRDAHSRRIVRAMEGAADIANASANAVEAIAQRLDGIAAQIEGLQRQTYRTHD